MPAQSIRQYISRLLRSTFAGRWLLDEAPARVADGKGRRCWSTRRMAQVLKRVDLAGLETQRSLELYPGGDFLDVGAHHGAYCFLLAGKAASGSSFYALEPELIAYRVLQHNLSALGDAFPEVRFAALPMAAGDGRPCKFTYPMGAQFHPRVLSGTDSGDPTLRLDDVVSQFGLKPSFVKVDVEGAELFVLRGMQKILSQYKPKLMVEMHPLFQPEPDGEAQVRALLEKAGYKLIESLQNQVTRQEFWAP